MEKIINRSIKLCGVKFAKHQIISISFLGPRKIARINREFVGHTGLTDVITFDYRNTNDCKTNVNCEEVAAELIISPDVADMAAKKYGTSFEYETILYIVHGLLHLSGEDDMKPNERKKMKQKETKIMNILQKEFDFDKIFKKNTKK